jgi:5-enolpyruvylshikimate-3-phosphate synthase
MFASETITIEHAEAVSKSYPEFWEHFEKLT